MSNSFSCRRGLIGGELIRIIMIDMNQNVCVKDECEFQGLGNLGISWVSLKAFMGPLGNLKKSFLWDFLFFIQSMKSKVGTWSESCEIVYFYL